MPPPPPPRQRLPRSRRRRRSSLLPRTTSRPSPHGRRWCGSRVARRPLQLPPPQLPRWLPLRPPLLPPRRRRRLPLRNEERLTAAEPTPGVVPQHAPTAHTTPHSDRREGESEGGRKRENRLLERGQDRVLISQAKRGREGERERDERRLGGRSGKARAGTVHWRRRQQWRTSSRWAASHWSTAGMPVASGASPAAAARTAFRAFVLDA
mmetsp:Transcript_9958/g.40310  ORF Transcript_9958/g.40310 Transcript_9958/m.40310 type:complete len:209 (-) Transcript_9958:657-1283(-)